MSSLISSQSSRRIHYQTQHSTIVLLQNHMETINLNDSFSSFNHFNPLVTVVYISTSSSSKENQQVLLNSYASCRRLLDYLKPVIGIQQDETIDLMDNEGKLKELNIHDEEYASNYLTARNTYYVFKIEIIDTTSNEKRYTAFFNMDQIDQKLHSILQNSLTSLNSSSKIGKGGRRTNIGTSKPTSSAQVSSNTTQTKGKKTNKLK